MDEARINKIQKAGDRASESKMSESKKSESKTSGSESETDAVAIITEGPPLVPLPEQLLKANATLKSKQLKMLLIEGLHFFPLSS